MSSYQDILNLKKTQHVATGDTATSMITEIDKNEILRVLKIDPKDRSSKNVTLLADYFKSNRFLQQ